jgi:hypothetical protein
MYCYTFRGASRGYSPYIGGGRKTSQRRSLKFLVFLADNTLSGHISNVTGKFDYGGAFGEMRGGIT